jgi:endonuclease-3
MNWENAFKPLIKKYKGKKHPLDYKNTYQLLVMVVLSARDTDDHINKLAPALFEKFPDMKSLSKATVKKLMPLIGKVRSAFKKIPWLIQIAKTIKDDRNIPLTLDELVELPGIGRKSANVIMREAGVKAEGIIVDLHVVRVAPRLGITKATNPEKIEKDLMNILPQKQWGEAGMAMSFLGREICRPKEPMHSKCVMKGVCLYYKTTVGKIKTPAKVQRRKEV